MKKIIYAIALVILVSSISNAQCIINDSLVFQFIHNNHAYQIIKSKLDWNEAANCAKSKNAYLAEINTLDEQNAINLFVGNAGIQLSQTTAADGGGASYLWIGGNDKDSEGVWNWNGDNDSTFIPFWKGKFPGGSTVNGMYANWGNEPDDYAGVQDGLGLALTNWPLGIAGQWNDLNLSDQLFYLIEFNNLAGVNEMSNKDWSMYPNPANDKLYITNGVKETLACVKFYNYSGSLVKSIPTLQLPGNCLVNDMEPGIYFIEIISIEGEKQISKMIVE